VGRPVLSGARLAAATVAKYPSNAPVPVFYNPANPAEAMLEPANLINARMALLGAASFGGIGALGIFVLCNVQ
jgi:Protein of unknown function (DUF3592)